MTSLTTQYDQPALIDIPSKPQRIKLTQDIDFLRYLNALKALLILVICSNHWAKKATFRVTMPLVLIRL